MSSALLRSPSVNRPDTFPPIGLRLTRSARVVAQAFDRAMAEAGGSASTWQVLLLIRTRQWGTQSKMAEAMGLTSATLTHHLNALEERGLVRRWREPSNRRVQHVELTPGGGELFDRLRVVAQRYDERVRSGLTDEETHLLAELLDRVQAGVEARARPATAGSG